MRMEGDSLFLNLTKGSQGENLESAGIRQDRPVPVHKPVKASQLLNCLVSRAHVHMVSVRQLDLGSDLTQIIRGNGTLYGCRGSHIHKNRGLHRTVNRLQLTPLRSSVCCNQSIFPAQFIRSVSLFIFPARKNGRCFILYHRRTLVQKNHSGIS